MQHPIRRGRRLLAGLLAGTALATAVPAQASAENCDVCRFVPLRLTAHNIEDGWPDSHDEPRMYYRDQTFAAVIKEKQTLFGLPATTFRGSMSIDLWERDNGWSDANHLGKWSVGSEVGEHEAEFGSASGWWYYTLVYDVESAS